MPDSPYSPEELTAQRLAGESEIAARSGRAIRSALPPVAQEFLATQPLLVAGAADRAGDVWATMLTGLPGFLRPAGPAAVDVLSAPVPGDALDGLATRRGPLGALAIEPATRRRVRLNGTTEPLPGSGFRLHLDQVVANCPKYLQARTPRTVTGTTPGPVRRDTALDAEQAAAVARADTFFVATSHPDGSADASHRGGSPGFVEVTGPTTLRWPEYAGNSMYLTLGNLLARPRAGLLFPDFGTGGLLQVTGTARVDFAAAAPPGARSLVEFTVTGVVDLPSATPLRWSAPEPSRFNPPARAGVSA
ncbi:pyridoxamine 5'-phosphate oxidase family protein [Kineococcus sp. NUM-3379]